MFLFISDEILSFKLHDWLEELLRNIADIEKRCQIIHDVMNELIVTLRIIRLSDTSEITCLQDLIDCYTSLRNNKRTREEVRTDLVREYIAIVNIVRLEVEKIDAKDLFISFEESLSTKTLDLFHILLFQTQTMLEPLYIFVADDTRELNKHTTTGLEKEMFHGFQSYLPSLVKQLHSLVNSLTLNPESEKAHEDESIESDLHSEEHTDENKENIGETKANKGHQNCKICLEKAIVPKKEKSLVQQTSVHYIETWTPS